MPASALDPTVTGSTTTATDHPQKIGGILHLLAFILIINPLRILYVIFNVAMPATEAAPYLVAGQFDMAANLTYLIYAVVVLYYFFRRHHWTPGLVIVLFLLNIVFVAMNGTMAQWIPLQEQHGAETWRVVEFVAASGWFLVWTLYLIGSKRVKGTFVR